MNDNFGRLMGIGDVDIAEGYEFYGEPVLFICKDHTDLFYLAIQSGKTPSHKIWLLTALSPRRFLQLRAGELDLYWAFADAERGQVYRAHLPRAPDGAPAVEWVPSAELTKKELPPVGERLDREKLKLLEDDAATVGLDKKWRPTRKTGAKIHGALKPVTHDEAAASLRRFYRGCPRFSIPANEWRDDDLILGRYIRERRNRDKENARILRQLVEDLSRLPEDALGTGYTPQGEAYAIRDEMIDRIVKALNHIPAAAVEGENQ